MKTPFFKKYVDSENEDGSIESYDMDMAEQLIIMVWGDLDKDMCMTKPFKTFMYFFFSVKFGSNFWKNNFFEELRM